MPDRIWTGLQNGSDIRGIATDGVEGQEVNLTDDAVGAIVCAFALWLCRDKGKCTKRLRISLGIDSRISGPHIKSVAKEALESIGCSVYDCGLSSTPAMFMTTVVDTFLYDGAIMVTASHLPYNRNGLKFFTDRGGLEKEDIAEILTIAQRGEFEKTADRGEAFDVDFMSVYCEILRRRIIDGINHPTNRMQPLKGFRIVVDAGNGAGGFFADKVLEPLGANTSGSCFLEPDGRFPNHIPNPENRSAVESICGAVKERGADLGVIFDADVDRAGAVGPSGREINRNRLIALMGAIVLEEHKHSTIVTDSVTSTGLKKFIEEDLGGVHHRFKRGYKNVIDEGIRINREGGECYLAMETSGHGALRENYFLDDGAYLIVKILIKMVRMRLAGSGTIEALIRDLPEAYESAEFRLKIDAEDYRGYAGTVLSGLNEFAPRVCGWKIAPDNYEGIRVSCDRDGGDGWFLLRMSLHEPLMPLNIESDSRGGVKIIAEKIVPLLRGFARLDIAPVLKYIG